MYTIVYLLTFMLFAVIAIGFYLSANPMSVGKTKRWFKPVVASNLAVFFTAQLVVIFFGVSDVMASPEAQAVLQGGKEISVGMGLAMIGIALPTGFSTLAAGIAVGPIGAASLAAVVEKPEIFGRTLVYLGLAEGIAIYGLVLSILLFEKI